MREYAHFINVLDDLRHRVEGQRDEYELLRASGLIRLLIRDRPPLIERVNEAIGLPIRFRVGIYQAGELAHIVQFVTDWANPNPSNLRYREVGLDELLAFNAIGIKGELFSVNHVIGVCANKLGGVHFDDKMSAGQRALKELHESLELNDVGALAETIAGVGAVLIAGLHDLYVEAGRRR